MLDINIFFQVCAAINVLIILICFVFKKKMVTRTNIIYIEMMVVDLLALVFDIYQMYCLKHYHEFNNLYVKEVCKIRMIFVVALNFHLLRYVSVDVFKIKPIKRVIFTVIAYLVLIASVALLVFLPLDVINPGEMNAYVKGTALYAMYGFVAIYLVIVFFFTLIKENNATKKRKRTLRYWIYIWCFAAGIELFINAFLDASFKLPVLGFASSLCIIIFFIVLENPDYSLDKETWTFNQTKCMQYTFDLHRKNKEYHVLAVLIDNSKPQFKSYVTRREILIDYARTLELMHKGKVFKSDNNNFLVVTRKKENLNYIIEHMMEKYNNVDADNDELHFYHNLKFIKLENPYVASDNINVLEILRDVSIEFAANKSTDTILSIDDSVIEKRNKDKEIEAIVDNAIRNDLILVYLQPIYGLKEKSFVSAEALTRIMDKDGNIIYPGSFIEVCERNGSIFKLGTLVFEHICRFIKKYDMEALGLHYIEVNLSALQCEYQGLAKLYTSIMRKYGIDPKYINLEITETGNANREHMIANMNKLVEYGVSFSLDDFGTGNSNLNYIIDMPVNLVKFDKTMVTDYFEDKKAKFVMNSAISMIKEMDLKIVLEGIEEKTQIQSLQRRKIDVDYIQGYYYSKPIPEDDFVEFIKEKNKVKTDVLKK